MPTTQPTDKNLYGAAKAAADKKAAASAAPSLAAAIAAGPHLPANDPMAIPDEALKQLGETGLLTDDEEEDEDTDPEAEWPDELPSADLIEPQTQAAQGGEEMVDGYEYDDETDDYIMVSKPASAWLPSVSSDEREPDGFDISHQYHTSEGADFDYRWIPRDQERQHFDRSNGFVPVKKLLDNRYRLQGGVVSNGDLVLARRPKQVTEQRAKAQAGLASRLSGHADGFRKEAAQNGSVGFGDIEHGEEKISIHPEEMHERLERERKGSKSYAINAPFQRDKVAERHRAAVGG